MFTIKVTKQSTESRGQPEFSGRFTTRIIEAIEVDVHILRPGELHEVAGFAADGKSFALYIAPRDKPRPDGFTDEMEFWFEAFIENAAGATTHIVRF